MTDKDAEIKKLREWLLEALDGIQELRIIGYGDLLPDLEDYLVSAGVLDSNDPALKHKVTTEDRRRDD